MCRQAGERGQGRLPLVCPRERDTMREMFGAGDGVRLFSQLQKDKQRAEKEGGVAKESAFQVGRREGKKKVIERDKGKGEREEGDLGEMKKEVCFSITNLS